MTDTTDILITPSDLPYRLPADAYAYLVRTLAAALPPPPDDSDETRHLRKQTIISHISTLRPNDSIETSLAVDYILASEQSRDAARWVHIYRAQGEHKLAAQCDAKALAWGRQATSVLREINRRQAETKARHADSKATDTAERIEHVAMVMTAEAIERMPDPTPIHYVPQRQPEPAVSKTTRESRPTKTETPPRQPERERHYESPARRAMLDQAQFGPRGPGWDRPMFFPDKKAGSRKSAESNPAEATSRPALADER